MAEGGKSGGDTLARTVMMVADRHSGEQLPLKQDSVSGLFWPEAFFPSGRILGQAALAATTLTDVYTVPASKNASVTLINICNRAGAGRTYRLSVAKGGAADDVKQYLDFDVALAANASVRIIGEIPLQAGDVVRAYASAADSLTVSIFGREL